LKHVICGEFINLYTTIHPYRLPPIQIPLVLVNNLPGSFRIGEVGIQLDHVRSSQDDNVHIYISNHMNPSITNTMLQSLKHQIDDSNHEVMNTIINQMTIILNPMIEN